MLRVLVFVLSMTAAEGQGFATLRRVGQAGFKNAPEIAKGLGTKFFAASTKVSRASAGMAAAGTAAAGTMMPEDFANGHFGKNDVTSLQHQQPGPSLLSSQLFHSRAVPTNMKMAALRQKIRNAGGDESAVHGYSATSAYDNGKKELANNVEANEVLLALTKKLEDEDWKKKHPGTDKKKLSELNSDTRMDLIRMTLEKAENKAGDSTDYTYAVHGITAYSAEKNGLEALARKMDVRKKPEGLASILALHVGPANPQLDPNTMMRRHVEMPIHASGRP